MASTTLNTLKEPVDLAKVSLLQFCGQFTCKMELTHVSSICSPASTKLALNRSLEYQETTISLPWITSNQKASLGLEIAMN
jgi:hypothetical protein